ncbi:MAG TPA: type II secretion system minor pseudopilin GspK [Desulfuromonadaceae bacterium]|jgi:general secretion pathway protein K
MTDRSGLGRGGFALVLTLVVTALMMAVAAELIHQVYVDTSLSRGFRDGQQASLLAGSGIEGGAKLIQLVITNQDYSSLSDKWASPLKLDDETGSIEITASEESGKINLNNLVQPNDSLDEFTLKALKQLGKRLQVPDQCWTALADWLDSNDLPQSNGAETSYYKTLKPPYSARNGKLATLAELSLIKGFTSDVVARLRPFVTTYASQTGININTAPQEVIAALDTSIDDRLAERIIEERKLKPFSGPGDLSRVDSKLSIALAGKIGVKGSLYRITAVGLVKDTARTVEAVARISGGKPEYLSWQEY